MPVEDLDGIEAYMRQLNERDPRGESFRYARSRDATRTLGADLVHISIRWFAIHMEKLADYLDGLENWGQNKSCSKSYAKTERSGNVMQRGGFFQEVAMA